MTFLELCKHARQECGIQGQGPSSVSNQVGILKRVVEWVRDADLYIQRNHPDWDFLWSEYTANTTLGSRTLTPPSDVGAWDMESFAVDIGTTTGYPIPTTDFHTWRTNRIVSMGNASPTGICVLPDGNLSLDAPADGVYEIYGNYWKTPTKMTENTDTPPYNEEFQRAIIAKAMMWYFEDTEMGGLYVVAEREFNSVFRQLQAKYLPEYELAKHSPEPIVVVPQ